jgi:two-component system response regulator AtoC
MLVQTSVGFRYTTAWGSPLPVGDFPPGLKKAAAARILVVDDEALVRWSVAETLRSSAYEVVEAEDAASALQRLVEMDAPPDAVLLDLRLPDCDDLALLETLRLLTPTTAFVVMTAFNSPEIAAEARRLGAYAVIDKPFDVDVLVPLLERALG